MLNPFGHGWELLILLVIVLVIFGPGKLPDIGNAVGRTLREFRKASQDLTEQVREGASGGAVTPASPAASEPPAPPANPGPPAADHPQA